MKKVISKRTKKFLIVHYSCSDLNETSPSVSSISVLDLENNELKTFSRKQDTIKDEIEMLRSFILYISKLIEMNYVFVGWNWQKNFGLLPILRRYEEITSKKIELNTKKIIFYDLFSKLSKKYPKFYGSLKTLFKYNIDTVDDYIDGSFELRLLKQKDFVKLSKSTSFKVKGLKIIFDRFLNNTLRIPTMNEFLETYSEYDHYNNFLESIENINSLIDEKRIHINDPVLERVLRNMLYVNVITIMETYLADRFIEKVMQKESYFKEYISKAFLFESKTSFFYFDLLNKKNSNLNFEDYVKGKCVEDIRSITFHDLDKAKKKYETILKIPFPEDIEFLKKAVNIRHDLVHRNGKNKEEQLVSLSIGDIEKLIVETKKFVQFINKKTESL